MVRTAKTGCFPSRTSTPALTSVSRASSNAAAGTRRQMVQ